MGVGVMIGATLLGGYLQGRAARQQANAQAAQAQANADIAYNNAQKLQEQAEKQAQNNEINEENKRRRLLQLQGQQSGLSVSELFKRGLVCLQKKLFSCYMLQRRILKNLFNSPKMSL